MLKEHASVFRRLMIFADLCLGAIAFFLAYYLRNQVTNPPLLSLRSYLWILPDLLFMWWVLLYFLACTPRFVLKAFRKSY